MNSAIASAGKNRVAAPAHGLRSQRASASGRLRLHSFGFNASAAQQSERIVYHLPPPWGMLARSRVVDQRYSMHRNSHPEERPPASTHESARAPGSYLRMPLPVKAPGDSLGDLRLKIIAVQNS
jgi:hypothetical protein